VSPYEEAIVFTVAHIGLPYRKFRLVKKNGHIHQEFLGTKGLCRPNYIPDFCSDRMAIFLLAMESFETFSHTDVARVMHPNHFYSGAKNISSKLASKLISEAEQEGWIVRLERGVYRLSDDLNNEAI
jgi:hypothetical protein